MFQKRHDYRAFLQVLTEGLEKHPVRLVSYCLLSNHWHLVMGPMAHTQLSKMMQWVTVTHAVRWRHHTKTVGQGPVYQGRYTSVPVLSALSSVRRFVSSKI